MFFIFEIPLVLPLLFLIIGGYTLYEFFTNFGGIISFILDCLYGIFVVGGFFLGVIMVIAALWVLFTNNEKYIKNVGENLGCGFFLMFVCGGFHLFINWLANAL